MLEAQQGFVSALLSGVDSPKARARQTSHAGQPPRDGLAQALQTRHAPVEQDSAACLLAVLMRERRIVSPYMQT